MKQTFSSSAQDLLYQQAIETYGREILRFVTAYEQNNAKRQDLLQEVHFAIWRSMAGFKQQCSLRTWVYRVAHNVGVSHIDKNVRTVERNSVELDESEQADLHTDENSAILLTDRRLDLERIMCFIYTLEGLERQLILLYLEGLDAASISEITGLSSRNVATKIHRIKSQLARQFGNRSTI